MIEIIIATILSFLVNHQWFWSFFNMKMPGQIFRWIFVAVFYMCAIGLFHDDLKMWNWKHGDKNDKY